MRNMITIGKFLLVGAVIGGMAGTISSGLIAKQKKDRIVKEWRSIPVVPPEGKPGLNQESVDLALAIYGIQVPNTARHPVMSLDLEDRGLSTRYPWADKIVVEVGPSAFESWGLLASTLAHELEVHCQQNFFLINVMDFLQLEGTLRAERQAYLHELRNAKRFGLPNDSVDQIAMTMEHYYRLNDGSGNQVASQMSRTLSRWLAKSFVSQK